jgi:hypothetical protein
LVKEIMEVEIISFIPIPVSRGMVINPGSNSGRRRIGQGPKSRGVASLSVGVTCHPIDDMVLERARNNVSSRMVDKHEDKG